MHFKNERSSKIIEKKRKARDYEFGCQQLTIRAMLQLAQEETGLTQEELAKKLDTKKSANSRIENHTEDIKPSTLKKIARALGKNCELKGMYFLYGHCQAHNPYSGSKHDFHPLRPTYPPFNTRNTL